MNDTRLDLGAAGQVAIERLEVGSLSLEKSSARSVQAETVVTHLSAMGSVTAEGVAAQATAIGALQARQVDVHGSAAGVVRGRTVSASRSALGLVMGEAVQTQGTTFAGLLVARQVSGTVRPMLDWRGALILGLIIGSVIRWGIRH